MRYRVTSGALSALLLLLSAQVRAAPPPDGPLTLEAGSQRTRVVCRFAVPQVVETPEGSLVLLPETQPDLTPGAPRLPWQALSLPVPPGRRARSIKVSGSASLSLPLKQPVAHASEPLPLSQRGALAAATPRNAAIYNSAGPYPDYAAAPHYRARHERRDGRQTLALALYPVQYLAAESRLLAHRELTIEVEWEERREPRGGDRWRPLRQRPAAEAATYAATRPLGRGTAPGIKATRRQETANAGDSHPLAPEGPFDHVIVAPATFIDNTPAPWNLAALSAARSAEGLSSTSVAIEWIVANYEGRDDAEKLRNFVRDAYDLWQTRYLLLVGTTALVPTRKLYSSFSVTTDQVPAEGVYYGCLDGDFDYNQNDIFGELGDGPEGEEVDLVAEVMVGRFPAATTNDVAQMVRKTLTYEALPAAALRPSAFVAEWLGFGGVAEYGDGAMEQIRLGSTSSAMKTTGFANSYMAPQLDYQTTLYDGPAGRWPNSDFVDLMNSNYHLINHLGHGSEQIGFKLYLTRSADRLAIAGFTNSTPSFIYSQACRMGAYDKANYIAQHFMASPGGVFATVMNSRDGWGYRESIDGPSQFFQRHFWQAAFSGSGLTFGELNARGREAMRQYISPHSGNVFRWIYYELTLFGDPATPFAAPLQNVSAEITTEGLLEYCYPGQPLTITANIAPAGLVDRASPVVIWRNLSQPAIWYTNALPHQTRLQHEVTLPQQPFGTTIEYSLHATTHAGLTTTWPAEGVRCMTVSEPRHLTITGSPQLYGATEPPYGNYLIASGNLIRAAAPARVVISDAISRFCIGYNGSGSPGSGTTTNVSFRLETDSSLTWLWVESYLLHQTSNIPGYLIADCWYNRDDYATTLKATEIATVAGEEYRFVDWWLNGQRQPSPSSVAQNPVVDILMQEPVTAAARYLPATLDSDNNGLADWWELRYYGSLGRYAPDDDSDDDGFTTAEEFDDLSDPTNPHSYPAPPSIRHTPLAAIQGVPTPYALTARISDASGVASATLQWQINAQPWQELTLDPAGDDLYAGIISGDVAPGTTIHYRIEASDPGGRTALHGPHTLNLVYPEANLTPMPQLLCNVLRGSNTTTQITVANSGNAPLEWQLYQAWYEPVTPGITNRWHLERHEQPWQLSTNRTVSSPLALHGVARSAGSYTSPAVYAGLESPLFMPTTNSTLSFSYWIASEIDKAKPGFSFDGMIVEVSTNSGSSFQQLPGPYTHRQTGWNYSPWPQDTPCFSGTGEEGWQSATFDLSAFAGKEISFRFLYGGDNNSDGEGVYLDDIELVAPDPLWDGPWIEPVATNGTLDFPAANEYELLIHGRPSFENEILRRLILYSNDPVNPRLHSDITIALRALPWVGAPHIWQSSSDGSGIVTLTLPLAEADGAPLALALNFNHPLDGRPTLPPLIAASTHYGTPLLDATNASLSAIVSSDSAGLLTNVVTLLWNSRLTEPPLPPLTTNLTLNLSVSNPWFTAPTVTTLPFMVDNEAPTAPLDLGSTTHQLNLWSRESDFGAAWTAASDGAGGGGLSYRAFVADSPAATLPPDTPATTATTTTLTAPEGSNLWLAVQAADRYGNTSALARVGPYRIDLTPPTAAAAWVAINRSLYGNYVVGDRLQASWGGFSDALSGIAFYQLMIETEAGFIPAHLTSATNGSIRSSRLDTTNRLWVYAIDQVGNASLMVSDATLLLAPDGDWDGDGHSNATEELAGTDATDPASLLRLYIVADPEAGSGVALLWYGVAGRSYTLLRATTLTPQPNWQPLPAATALPGNDDFLRYRAEEADTPRAFYRLRLE